MNKIKLVNIACGTVYVKNSNWVNLDIISNNKYVKKTNLLNKLPFSDNSVDGIYCSHFLEHIPLEKVSSFLYECFRILKKGGVLRLVLPDFEALSKEYLRQIKLKDYSKAKIVLMTIIDQCVRKKPGGILNDFYRNLLNKKKEKRNEIKYIKFLNGVDFETKIKNKKDSRYYIEKIISLVKNTFLNIWLKFIIMFLPKTFKSQNISLARIGELHHWIWDYYSLSDYLLKAGFSKVIKQKYNKTISKVYKLYVFDQNHKKNKSRGIESMYIEVLKK
tara:strand:+ start:4046 stop:4870 length:825 start_codon:yes stop_codon:yes gene_type:complete